MAILFERIGPYHHARIGAAAELGEVAAVEFSSVDPVYAWNQVTEAGSYERTTLFSHDHVASVPFGRVRRRVFQTLDEARPDVVAIPGWASRGALAALSWCVDSGIPAVVMSASWDPGTGRNGWYESIKRRILPLYSSALVAGEPQRQYVHRLGMPMNRIFTGYDAVDNVHFAEGADRVRRSASSLRQTLGLPRHYFLTVCRFVQEKNLHRLLLAYADYRAATSRPWHLVLVGDGPLKANLLRLRSELALDRFVHLVPFQQYDALPTYYGLAEALVLPSVSETWGLVVNEAMAAGLPVLVSRRCGCASDLVREGRNGLTFDPTQTGSIRDALLGVASDPCNHAAMGRCSRDLIGRWSVECFAQSLWRAASMAAEPTVNRAGPLARLLLELVARR